LYKNTLKMASWANIVKTNIPVKKDVKPQKSSYLDEKVEFINKYDIYNELYMKGIQDDILSSITDFIPEKQLKNSLIRNVNKCCKLNIPNNNRKYSILYFGKNIFDEWNYYCFSHYIYQNINILYYSINYNLDLITGNMNTIYQHIFNIQFYRYNVKNQLKKNSIDNSCIEYSFEFCLITIENEKKIDFEKCTFDIIHNNHIISLNELEQYDYYAICKNFYEKIIKNFKIYY
jgi:hypothetical protein